MGKKGEPARVVSERSLITESYEKSMQSYGQNYVGLSNSAIIDDYKLAKIISPYAFKFGPGPKTYKDVLTQAFALSDEDYNANKELIDSQAADANLKSTHTANAMKPGMINEKAINNYLLDSSSTFTHFSTVDTSLGGQDAINCRPAFCRDDDIIHPQNALLGNPDLGGMGRVYHEAYYSTQQILWITVGVPEFQELWEFYTKAVDGNLASEVSAGEVSWARMFGSVAGGVFKLALKVCNPLEWIDGLATLLSPNERITRYYQLRPTMALYYRYVNTIMGQLAVTMGLTYNPWYMSDYESGGLDFFALRWIKNAARFAARCLTLSLFRGDDNNMHSGGSTSGSQGSAAVTELYQASLAHSPENRPYDEAYMNSMPLFMRQHGPNIYDILSKRDSRYDQNRLVRGKIDSDEYLKATSIFKKSDGGFFDGFSNRLWATICGADKFIGFRINKTSDSSETFSNQTGQPTIANTINQMAASGRDARFSAGGSMNKFMNLVGSIPGIGMLVNGAANLAKGFVNSFGVGGLASAILTGSGFIDIPDIWTGSSVSKSFNFSFTFRSCAGDNATIFQDCYIPLTLILAMACPRSVGQNSYATPFLIRAYAKGMFGIPLGIIDSLQVTRGSSEFGWNMSKFPTTIKVNCSIKDLSPIMHMGATVDSSNFAVFGGATPMQEYMHTLGGLGLQERFLWSSSFIKRLQLSSQLWRSTWLNPLYWATQAGSWALGRIAGVFSPTVLYGT